MKLHRLGKSLWLMFIKDFGDDLGMFLAGYGLGTGQIGAVFIGLIVTAISIFLKYTIFKQREVDNIKSDGTDI